MLREKMEAAGVKKALEDLGYSYEVIFGGLSPELEEEYAACSWQKVGCNIDGIRLGYVIHCVPGEEQLKAGRPWEEWFFQHDAAHHHVLFREKQDCCDREVLIPETDREHPEEVRGKLWHYYQDGESLPYLAKKPVL